MSLFDTGIRPVIDAHLLKLAEDKRDYGDYWSASSAGKCMRLNIFERLGIPPVHEDARKQRVFSVGDVFHEWIQRITKEAGLSIAQEIELQDEELMVRGHPDDIIAIPTKDGHHLLLYDYKSAHSNSFHRGKNRYPLSYYYKMQMATYMYMLRRRGIPSGVAELSEARLLKISKDDLCMDEYQLMWSSELEKEVVAYWTTINGYFKDKKIPKCTCEVHEGGFMAWEKWNPYFYEGEPCSMEWYKLKKGSTQNAK